MLYDTHAHINSIDFCDDINEVIENAKSNNVSMIVIGFNQLTNDKAIELNSKYGFKYTLGIHPSDICDYNEKYLNQFNKLLLSTNCVGIGECGLDYYWYKDNKEEQKKVFIYQIELAISLGKPLVIHVRDAISDAYDILSKYKGQIKGVMHGFSGSQEMAIRFYELGLKIGIGGTVTFKNAVNPKNVAKSVPLDGIILETDCPYLTPHPFRGKRNEPAYVRLVAEEVAKIRGISTEEVEEKTTENAVELFRLGVHTNEKN